MNTYFAKITIVNGGFVLDRQCEVVAANEELARQKIAEWFKVLWWNVVECKILPQNEVAGNRIVIGG